MQNESQQDWIRQLIEATRDEERAKLESQAILNEVNQRLIIIESFQRELGRELERLRGIVQATYSNVGTLAQLVAAILHGDRVTLGEMQARITETALEMSLCKDASDISIKAGGDVQVSADRVGGDKGEG